MLTRILPRISRLQVRTKKEFEQIFITLFPSPLHSPGSDPISCTKQILLTKAPTTTTIRANQILKGKISWKHQQQQQVQSPNQSQQ